MAPSHTHSHLTEAANLTVRRMAIALAITLTFVVLEALAGFYANSLSLLTDAAHNFTDVVALALSGYAVRLAARPAHSGKTFGYHRAGILIALFNSTTLILITLGIFYEAYQRLVSPPEVKETVLIVVAIIAFVINTGTALLVKRGSESDLNVRSAYVHLAGDAASTLGAVLAGIGIALTGLQILDPLASVLIGLLILWNAWGIVRESVDILLEGTPGDVNMKEMVNDLRQVKGVYGIHDLHVWRISASMRLLSAHIVTDDILISEGDAIQGEIAELLVHKYSIAHATLQFECQECEPNLLYCELPADLHLHTAGEED